MDSADNCHPEAVLQISTIPFQGQGSHQIHSAKDNALC
jgi:hypothetical protein